MNTKVSKQGNTEYESEGTKYYKRAFFAQAAIGIGSLVQAVAVVVIAIALSGCAGMMSKGTQKLPMSPAYTAEEIAKDATKGRIDASAIIKAADEADCNLGTLMYSEGRKESKFALSCAQMPFPPRPQQGF